MVQKNENHNFYKSEYHIDQLLENEKRTCTFCIGKSSLYIFTGFKQYFINFSNLIHFVIYMMHIVFSRLKFLEFNL